MMGPRLRRAGGGGSHCFLGSGIKKNRASCESRFEFMSRRNLYFQTKKENEMTEREREGGGDDREFKMVCF